MKVDLVLADTQDLHVCESNDTKGLVDLKGVDVVLAHACVLQSLGHGKSRCSGELGGVLSSVTPSEDLCNGLQVELLELGLGDENDGGSAIGEGRGVGCGDGAVSGLEDGLERAGLGLVELWGLNQRDAEGLQSWGCSRSLARHPCRRQCLACPCHR